MVEIYPVIETLDLVYAGIYGWGEALVKVTDTVVIRPDIQVSKSFMNKKPLKQYIREKIKRRAANQDVISTKFLDKLNVMMDHGIFSNMFKKYFGVKKTPVNLIKVYDTLRVEYGLAYDVPLRLYITSILSRSMKLNLINEKEIRENLKKLLNNCKAKNLKKALMECEDILREISYEAVNITIRRTKKMYDLRNKTKYFKNLVPVVQGLFKEDIKACIEKIFGILNDNNIMETYISIGTGGRVLSRRDRDNINYAVELIEKYSKEYDIKVKIHLLGWSSPRNGKGIVFEKIYSADSLTVRRRAGEGKIYVLQGDNIELKHVSEIDKAKFNCRCPACRSFKEWVLDPSCARRNDVRLVHSLYTLKKFYDILTNHR